MRKNCIFCKIAAKKVPARIEKETENFVVFADIAPKAPVHLLIVPKKHIQDIRDADDELWLGVAKIARQIGSQKGLTGYRLVHNVGTAAAVEHMHVHFLGEIEKTREV